MTTRTVLHAWVGLAAYDVLVRFGFGAVHKTLRACPVAAREVPPDTVSEVCRAVDEACTWYLKRTYCLQRSVVTTWLLRRSGIAAETVIGYRPVPFRSHAWVEADGVVVNDLAQYKRSFFVLDRV